MPALNLPDVCTASPARGKAFCHEHCELLQHDAPHVPLGLKDFLKFCGVHTGIPNFVYIDSHELIDKCGPTTKGQLGFCLCIGVPTSTLMCTVLIVLQKNSNLVWCAWCDLHGMNVTMIAHLHL